LPQKIQVNNVKARNDGQRRDDATNGTKGPNEFRKSFYSSTYAKKQKLQQKQQLPLAKYDMNAADGLESSFIEQQAAEDARVGNLTGSHANDLGRR